MRKNQEKFLKYLIIPTILFIFIIINYFNSFPLMMSFSRKIISSDPSNVDIFHIVKKITEGKIYKPTYPYKFKFKYNSSEICENPIKLIFLIKTSPLNLIRRNVIRQTWGSSKNFEEIRTIFLVGERDEDNLKLEKEFEEFHDIVQGNFSDTYYNLTLKTLMGLQWANEFCLENTEFFMFVDDDFYVSTKNILKFIKNPYLYPDTENNENIMETDPSTFSLYAGHVFEDAKPFRDYFDKFYISLKEYPYDKFPPYAGSVYILNQRSIKRIYYASLFIKPLRFEDVFIGTLAYLLKITPISNKENFVLKLNEKYNFTKFRKILASHGYGDTDKLWNVWIDQTLIH